MSRHSRSRSFPSKLLALARPLMLAGLLGGCSVVSSSYQLRGNRVDPEVLKELVPGTSSRADVTSLLGSPTAKAVFDDNTWFYITETTHARIGRTPGVTDQQVVAMGFDAKGTLKSVRTLDQDAGAPVVVVSRTTPSPGSEATFLQQLLGNVGKFSATPGTPSNASTGSSGASFGSGGQ